MCNTVGTFTNTLGDIYKKNAFYKIRRGIDLFDDTFVNVCL